MARRKENEHVSETIEGRTFWIDDLAKLLDCVREWATSAGVDPGILEHHRNKEKIKCYEKNDIDSYVESYCVPPIIKIEDDNLEYDDLDELARYRRDEPHAPFRIRVIFFEGSLVNLTIEFEGKYNHSVEVQSHGGVYAEGGRRMLLELEGLGDAAASIAGYRLPLQPLVRWTKRETGTWWKRSRDKILFMIIGGIVAILFGVLKDLILGG